MKREESSRAILKGTIIISTSNAYNKLISFFILNELSPWNHKAICIVRVKLLLQQKFVTTPFLRFSERIALKTFPKESKKYVDFKYLLIN